MAPDTARDTAPNASGNPGDSAGDDEALLVRRRRLKFRSWHRGTREADLLIGSFADAHLDTYDHAQLDRFEQVLAEEDPDIYDWMTSRAPIPERLDFDVAHAMRDFRFTPRQGS
jgi:antitoxin CptB